MPSDAIRSEPKSFRGSPQMGSRSRRFTAWSLARKFGAICGRRAVRGAHPRRDCRQARGAPKAAESACVNPGLSLLAAKEVPPDG